MHTKIRDAITDLQTHTHSQITQLYNDSWRRSIVVWTLVLVGRLSLYWARLVVWPLCG